MRKDACSAFQTAAFVVRIVQGLQELLEIQIKIPSLDLCSLSPPPFFFSFRGIANGLEVQRAYTPITPVNAEGFFEVLIKVNRCLCSIKINSLTQQQSSSMPQECSALAFYNGGGGLQLQFWFLGILFAPDQALLSLGSRTKQ